MPHYRTCNVTFQPPLPPLPPLPPPPTHVPMPSTRWLAPAPSPPLPIVRAHELISLVVDDQLVATGDRDDNDSCKSPTSPSNPWWPSANNSAYLDIKATFVGELWLLTHNATFDWNLLSPQTRSLLGFDEFLYSLRGSICPCYDQLAKLLRALLNLAHKAPEQLYCAVLHEQLGPLLGPEFGWVALPRTKSCGGSGSSW